MTQTSLITIDENRLSQMESRLDFIVTLISGKVTPPKEFGGMELAEEVTGLKKATIYVMVHKKKIPFIKRNGKLYFKRSQLISWIESGREVSLETA